MNIAVVDVAADSSGALSVLMDFYSYLRDNIPAHTNWYFFTSVINLDETDNIKNISDGNIKKSWIHRIIWEYFQFPKQVDEYKIDIVFSMQNKALPGIRVPQVVYFHNALHFVKSGQFSFWNKYERNLYLYCKLVTPITMSSLKKCDTIITQTETMKKELEQRVLNKKIIVMQPNSDVNVNVIETNNAITGFIYPCGPTPYKRHDIIIEAVKKAGKDFLGSILFTIDSSKEGYTEEILKLSGETKNIDFIGFLNRDALLEYYMNYGLIFASDVESYPIPFVEAMAFGTPIIARNMPYAREILRDYNNKFFFDSTDELAALLKDVKMMRRGKNKKIQDNSSWQKIIDIVFTWNNSNEF